MNDAEYVESMTEAVMGWPLPDSAVAVRRARGRALELIADNSDISLVEAILPGLVVALANLEARVAMIEASSETISHAEIPSS
ncbi:hypothetical protein NOU13_31430 [Rhodococcus erythropolis]|uniref:hypothetical protein n=1 Tax=Rhodococcus erythropolis TaxID=1833 RepID=UPI00210E71E9|nr:hypothetical protein [Rhodococcus erythropolis]MCQ4129018.1 hypothetical protein [Rhodococcus erythropolis]